MRYLIPILLAAGPMIAASQTNNTLTPEEKKAGWQLLFDGHTYNGWIDPARKTPPGDSWTIQDECLKAKPHPRITEDLFSARKFGDFELVWDWKIAPGGNSGLKYRIQDTVFLDQSKVKPGAKKFEETVGYEMEHHASSRAKLDPKSQAQDYVIGLEYQMIDNSAHQDAMRGGKYQTGAVYDMIPPSKAAAKPAGEFNHSRLVVRGDHVEHWLNGVKVVDADLNTDEVKASIAKRWAPAPELMRLLTERPKKQCPISLQNHGNDAWFRNIKIRPL